MGLAVGGAAGAGTMAVLWSPGASRAPISEEFDSACYRELGIPMLLGISASLATAALLTRDSTAVGAALIAVIMFVTAIRWWGRHRSG